MTDNPLIGVIERLTNVAQWYGTAFCKVTYDIDTETFYFSVILPEYVTVRYEGKKHD